MDLPELMIVLAFCCLVVLFISVAVSQPKRHKRCPTPRPQTNPPKNDYGKARIYRCPGCAGCCVRPLHQYPVKPCERCDTSLQHLTPTIEDRHLFIQRLRMGGQAFSD